MPTFPPNLPQGSNQLESVHEGRNLQLNTFNPMPTNKLRYTTELDDNKQKAIHNNLRYKNKKKRHSTRFRTTIAQTSNLHECFNSTNTTAVVGSNPERARAVFWFPAYVLPIPLFVSLYLHLIKAAFACGAARESASATTTSTCVAVRYRVGA